MGCLGYSLAYNLSSRLPEGILSIVIVSLLPLKLLRRSALKGGRCMSTVERLLKATEEIWAGYHEKPFVQGLGTARWTSKKFRRYIIQDYWYLMDYESLLP